MKRAKQWTEQRVARFYSWCPESLSGGEKRLAGVALPLARSERRDLGDARDTPTSGLRRPLGRTSEVGGARAAEKATVLEVEHQAQKEQYRFLLLNL